MSNGFFAAHMTGATPTTPPPPFLSRRSVSTSSPLNPSKDRSSSVLAKGETSRDGSLASAESQGSKRSSLPGSKYSPVNIHAKKSSLDDASVGILTGSVGGSYGPFPRTSVYHNTSTPAPYNHRDSIASSDVAIDLQCESPLSPPLPYRYSESASDSSLEAAQPHRFHRRDSSKSAINTALLWEKENVEPDDYLHEPNAALDSILDRQWAHFSKRGFTNVVLLAIVIGGLMVLFLGWPVWSFGIQGGYPSYAATSLGWNIGGINGTGQVPDIPGLPGLIDQSTPQDVRTRRGFDGETYSLVFSDEFNTDGRSFYPGDDPFWEAVDLNYWATSDLEWYDPAAVTTRNGKLEILMTQEPINGFEYRSGFLSSWNKFCFSGSSYIEVSVSLPGNPRDQAYGFWPGVWTLGNLVRAGYGATADGMWPYSYTACDVGTLSNQTNPDGMTPAAAKTEGDVSYGGALSYLPGQRASACTCEGEDHPGPRNSVGRGGPEIDLIEAQVEPTGVGSASQSVQIAPFDANYRWDNSSANAQITDPSRTVINAFAGGISQQTLSYSTLLDDVSYNGARYQSFGYEHSPGPDGSITWAIGGRPTWTMRASALGPNPRVGISRRIVAEEPMAINLNFALSNKFQGDAQLDKLPFPSTMYIDYVRVYQKGSRSIGCDPADHPTSDYINRHLESYYNANRTHWLGVPSNTWPKNRLSAAGCS